MDGDVEADLAFRRALGCYPTGVAVITAEASEGAWAITVNSFVSVSLSPRLVMWSLSERSYRYALFAGAPAWGVSVLKADQAGSSSRFATHGASPAEEHELDRLNPGGAPLLKDALSRFDCRTVARHHVADHLLIVGRVVAFDSHEGDALTYVRSRYGRAITGDL